LHSELHIPCKQRAGLKARRYKCWRAWLHEVCAEAIGNERTDFNGD